MDLDKSTMTINTYNAIAKKYDHLYNEIYYKNELLAFDDEKYKIEEHVYLRNEFSIYRRKV